jgi:trimethylamine-N-oxide reductase (cytochrome c)
LRFPASRRPEDFSREQFIASLAAVTASFGIPRPASAASLGQPKADGWRQNAAHWGTFYAYVENGRMLAVRPWSGDQHPSPMIEAMADLLYSPTRIQYPMVRAGFLRDRERSDRSKRGAEPFVRVSWEQATKIVAEELTRVKSSYGNRAFYAGSYGWQSAGVFHSARAAMQRLMGLHGGFVSYVNTYSAPVLPVITPHVLGDPRPVSSAWQTILDKSTLLVFLGFNPFINDEVRSGGNGNHDDYAYLAAIKAKKIPIVSINPVNTDTDEFFSTERLAIRPNTDTALVLALANVLLTEKLHDTAFLAKYTVGFDKFEAYLTGAADGIAKTPDWAAAITQIPAATIAALARRMAAAQTMIIGGFPLQRADHGAQPVWALITLAAMLGQIGTPGGGLQCNTTYSLGSPAGSAPIVPGLPGGANPVADFVPVNMWADLLQNPGKTIDYNGRKITYPDIKAVLWAGGNPLHHAQDVNRVLRAWQRPEVTIVADYNWTATAKYADIVLPATTTLERNDIISTDRYLFASQQVVPPMHGARSDFEIFGAIAQQLGYGQAYTLGRDESAWLQALYGQARTSAVARKLTLPDFQTFWSRGVLEFPPTTAALNFVAYAPFRADPGANPLGTPSGKIEIYSETIAGFKYDDSPGHATWLEPSEWLGSPKAKRFPLHLLSSHPKYRLHSQLNATSLRAKYEVREREPIWLHPADAAARGIKNGDIVRIFNDRGQTLAGAVVTERVRTGVVLLQEGAWYDPLVPGKIGTLDKHGSANNLTTDAPDSKLADGNQSNTALVQVERYAGPAPAITAFAAPPIQS